MNWVDIVELAKSRPNLIIGENTISIHFDDGEMDIVLRQSCSIFSIFYSSAARPPFHLSSTL
jgi:hypothetical protein